MAAFKKRTRAERRALKRKKLEREYRLHLGRRPTRNGLRHDYRFYNCRLIRRIFRKSTDFCDLMLALIDRLRAA